MTFHVACGGSFNFGFPAGGLCLNCSNKIFIFFSSLAFYSLDFHKFNFLIIPDKKRNAPLRFSPLRSPFNTKMLIVMKYSFLIKSY